MIGGIKMKQYIIVDIDGTVARIGDRLKYIRQEQKDWDSFYGHCDEDEPIRDVIDIVLKLRNKGIQIKFCTGRRESVRRKTELWIEKHMGLKPCDYSLLMRKDKDWRHDTDVKPMMIDIPACEVLCVFEDRNSMVRKWRELGYTCLQVNDGDF